jgi:nucleotide-sensitive chloride channel 1A
MPPTTIHTAPLLDSFTALADHQSQTPTTFYDAKPVLHYHAVAARALAAKDQSSKLPIFASRPDMELAAAEGEAVELEGSGVVTIDAFIGSELVLSTFELHYTSSCVDIALH